MISGSSGVLLAEGPRGHMGRLLEDSGKVGGGEKNAEQGGNRRRKERKKLDKDDIGHSGIGGGSAGSGCRGLLYKSGFGIPDTDHRENFWVGAGGSDFLGTI